RLAWFVDDRGVAQGSNWAILARRVIATAHADEAAAPAPAEIELVVPDGWQFATCGPRSRYMLAAPSGAGCEIWHGEGRAPPRAGSLVPGDFIGAATSWSVWSDDAGVHAEAETGELVAPYTRVECTAKTRAGLEQLRRVAETIHVRRQP